MSSSSSKLQSVVSTERAQFAVMIVGCAPTTLGGGLVCAIAVNQPVQSWTVFRCHDELRGLGEILSQFLPSLPSCPPSLSPGYDLNALILARNELQEWLTNILIYPGVQESMEARNFLSQGANMIPPQYEGVAWTQFNPVPSQRALPGLAHAPGAVSNTSSDNLDDMEMDDMFMAGDDGDVAHDDNFDDGDYIPSALERYKPTDEAITNAEEMELMDLNGEVEMVEDIGSLAQSLGASHLGRSLQLQAEMKHRTQDTTYIQQAQQGLKMGGIANKGASGGIGGAIERAQSDNVISSNNAFNSKPIQSAPRLDSFKLIKVIGKGSFGKVFLVKEYITGQIYALKVLRKDNIIKRNQVEHTKTERSVLGYVRHPFIVGMNMAFQSKDKLYFVLDYCAGGELFFHLGKIGRFPEPRACFYAAEIILAISYVHSLDIIYRDLKPENVLLDAEGHIRLTDFGLSKEGISNSSSGANSFCGTPEYLAPEILNRQGHGRAVDWWSLGALLYEMLTSLPPFYCQDRHRLFEKIRHSELPYPPSLSRPAKSVLVGLLTKDPTKRLGSGPTDAEEIKSHEFFRDIDWNKLAAGEMTPPWKPTISGSLDTSQFDKEFTNMPILSPQTRGMHGFSATPVDNPFEGFTFTDRRLHGPGAAAGMH